MKVEVVSVTSRIPGPSEPYYRYGLFLESLERVGAKPTILGMGEHWGGLMTKPRRLRDWLGSGACQADLLISSDSYDVIFMASPQAVGEAYLAWAADWPEGEEPLLFNAEKGLFPRGELAASFPDKGTPWRYLNSGLYIGRPATILKMLDAMWLDDIHDDYRHPDGRWTHPNDQGWYQNAFCCQAVPMRLDHHCEIFQCCSACEEAEFDFGGEHVTNALTHTEPLVWHFNGNSKDLLLPHFLRKWGMERFI